MTAVEYLSAIVEPTIAEFEADPTDRRRAILACLVTFHTVDYMTRPRGTGQIRSEFGRQSNDFALIDRVAHAAKHVQSGNDAASEAHKRPLSVDQLIERPPAMFGRAIWGLSVFGDSTGGVQIVREQDSDLLSALKRTMTFLRDQIAAAPGDK